MSAWDPVCPPGTVQLGTAVVPSFNAPGEALVAYAPWLDQSEGGRSDDVSPSDWRSPVAPAVGFDRVYGDSGSRLKKNPRTGTVAVWRPNPPPGYVAIGHIITPNHAPPAPSSVACVRVDLAAPSSPAPAPLWTTAGAESKLGSVPVAVYRTGVCAGAGWIAVASRVAEDIGRVPPPFEIRWDAGSGVRVEDEGETESGSGLESSVKISLSPNGPWAPVGVRQLGASSAAAVGVGPNRGTALVVDRRRGCVRAPATLTSLLPFEFEATNRLEATINGLTNWTDMFFLTQAYPVLLYHNPSRGALLDLVLTSAPPRDESDARHPGLCVNATPGGLHLRVYEPLVWRLKAFAGKLSGSSNAASGTNTASAETDDTTGKEGRKAAVKDPSMALGLLRLSSLGVRLTFKPAPRSRPSTVGPAAASVLAFFNLDRLPVAVGAFVRHRVRLKRSDIARQVIGHVKGEAMSQCLAVLTSVNHLGNVAGTLDAFGDNIRRLGNLGMEDPGKKKKGSIDDSDSDDDDAMGEDAEYPYVGAAGVGTGTTSSRSGVAGVVEKNVITGAITGSSELAKNVLVDGVGGIFTKSIAGFQKSGISGLATGTARGIGGLVTGAAAGAVGAVARVVEGVDATVGAAQDQVKGGANAAAAMRRRLPLATRGDGVVRSWNEADARGLHLLRSASVRDVLGNRRRPFASGRFEAALPLESDGRVLLLSHRHVGCVVSATEAIEWILPWNQVASISVDADTYTVVVHARGAVGDDGGKGSDPFGAVLAIGSQGKGSAADVDRAKRFAKCGSVGRAEAVAGRAREAWAANRAQGGGAAAAGGGF